MHGPVHKYDLNYLYSRSHFSRLLQAFAKTLIYYLSQKFGYASKIINPAINGFIPNYTSIHFHTFDH